MNIFKGEDIKPKPKIKKIKKNVHVSSPNMGGIYIIYLGYGLWKYGRVETIERLEKRIGEHKNDSIKKVEEFIGEKMTTPNATIVFKKETLEPKGYEEKIDSVLSDDESENIIRFKSNASDNSNREYFQCDNFDYIIQQIIPLIENV